MTISRTLVVAISFAAICASLGRAQPASQQQEGDTLQVAPAMDTVVPITRPAASVLGETRRNVAILPVEVVNADTNLAGLFGDIATRAMDETGCFLLVDRQNIAKILLEQSLAASGVVSDSSAATLGKITGASHIARIRMSSIGKGRWAGSATMTDVQSGTVVASAEEQREGDGLEVGRRILRNLAFSLAGKPTEDHLRYEAEQKRLALENLELEKSRSRRWKIGAGIGVAGRQDILLDDELPPRRAWYASQPGIQEWSVPDAKFSAAGDIEASWRMAPSWLLWSRLECVVGPGMPWHGRTSLPKDSSYNSGGVANRIELDQRIFNQGTKRLDRFSAVLGGAWIFLERKPFQFSAIVGLSGDWVRLQQETSDSSGAEASLFLNDKWSMNYLSVTQETTSSTLTGWGYGGRLGLRAEWLFLGDWSLGLEGLLSVVRIGEMTGTTKHHRTVWTRNTAEQAIVQSDSTWSEPAAMLIGDHLGTGEYRLVGNPDTRSTDPSGNLVTTRKATSEASFANISLRVSRRF